jgi:hypothetical protein
MRQRRRRRTETGRLRPGWWGRSRWWPPRTPACPARRVGALDNGLNVLDLRTARYAETVVPEEDVEFIRPRRRWPAGAQGGGGSAI